MSRPPKPKPLAQKVAAILRAVKKLERNGRNNQDGYDYTRATDVFESVRDKLFAAGVLLLPDEAEPTYIGYVTNGGIVFTECRLRVAYTFTDGTESLPPLHCHGVGRTDDEKALYIAQTGAEKAFLKRVGLMAELIDDPEFTGQADHGYHGDTDEAEPRVAFQRSSDKTVTHAQRRAFASACESTHKTGDEILHYLFSAHQGIERRRPEARQAVH